MTRLPLFVALLFFSMACAEMMPHSALDDSFKTSFAHDDENDQHRPITNATVIEDEGLVVQTGTKNVSNEEWNVYQVTLEGDGGTTVQFFAGGSYDPDHENETETGIATYEWKVLFDAPYGDDTFDLDGHTFTYSTDDENETNESSGFWYYTFANATVDSTGTTANQIRIELVTYDTAGKFSEKFRFYFVVVPENFGDEEPAIQFDAFEDNGTSLSSDTYTVSGHVLSGSENGEVYVEVAFHEENFSASSVEKYNMHLDGVWGRSDALGNGDAFELELSLTDLYSNQSETIRIYFKSYEGAYPHESWVTIQWVEFNHLF